MLQWEEVEVGKGGEGEKPEERQEQKPAKKKKGKKKTPIAAAIKETEGGKEVETGAKEGGNGWCEKANVNAADILLLNTPLHWAASLGEPLLVALLLEKGADVTLVNRKGQRPVDR